MVLSMASCPNILLVDDELNILPTSTITKAIEPVELDENGVPAGSTAAAATKELKALGESLADTQVGGAPAYGCTVCLHLGCGLLVPLAWWLVQPAGACCCCCSWSNPHCLHSTPSSSSSSSSCSSGSSSCQELMVSHAAGTDSSCWQAQRALQGCSGLCAALVVRATHLRACYRPVSASWHPAGRGAS